MSHINDLLSRIDGTLTTVRDRVKQEQQQRLQEHLQRQKRLEQYEKVQAQVVEVAKPRLEALAQRAGDRAVVTPSVAQTRRSVMFDFKSPRVYITLTFSVSPDREVKNAVVEYNLRIVPVLWKFDSHAEFAIPIDAFDPDSLARWLDDRIIGFVELYVKIHEDELYEQAEFVEDPVANVKFPKFAAGATLEYGGRTCYFIDEQTRDEFARRNQIAGA
jgi:YHS domain-containing protein